MSLQGAIEWIQTKALTLTNIQAAPDNPEDVSGLTTWVVTYPSSGTVHGSAYNWGYDLDNITVQILTVRNPLSEAMKRLEGYPHNLARLIQADVTMNGNVTTFENITYQFITLDWSGIQCVGYALTVNNVKTLTTH
jgi:hypothetical protein